MEAPLNLIARKQKLEKGHKNKIQCLFLYLKDVNILDTLFKWKILN